MRFNSPGDPPRLWRPDAHGMLSFSAKANTQLFSVSSSLVPPYPLLSRPAITPTCTHTQRHARTRLRERPAAFATRALPYDALLRALPRPFPVLLQPSVRHDLCRTGPGPCACRRDALVARAARSKTHALAACRLNARQINPLQRGSGASQHVECSLPVPFLGNGRGSQRIPHSHERYASHVTF